MILIVSQRIKIKSSRVPYSIQKKYGEQSIIPRIGDKLEDTVWKDPYEYEVTEIVLNYQDRTCYVEVAPLEGEIPEEKMEEFAEMVKTHGWSTSWGQFEHGQ